MKRFILLFLVILGVGIFLWHTFSLQKNSESSSIKKTTEIVSPSAPSTTLFVPYWTLDEKTLPSSYNSVVYFGITASVDGINTTDEGYKDIPRFFQEVNTHQKKLLTVQLLNQNTDEKILHDKTFQEKIIEESTRVAKENGFDGIVVDLEYKALAFDEVVRGITDFARNFATAVHKNNLSYYQLVYGDTFYRDRPFDVGEIGKVSDGIFVMAYDFHKANGNPGSNFPLEKMADEDYSFTQMVDDFVNKVPKDKLTIIFGMFGYDWTVDEKGQSIGEAESLTTNQILQKFIAHCDFKNCDIDQNSSGETHIMYTDTNNQNHIVWFEDLTSVYSKQEVVKAKGINQTAFWAYSYF